MKSKDTMRCTISFYYNDKRTLIHYLYDSTIYFVVTNLVQQYIYRSLMETVVQARDLL
jgi:hypothetical protein